MNQTKRQEYTRSLDQLMTISCILSGFAFSGLISLPGMEEEMFGKIVSYFRGDFHMAFYASFYSLFFSTVCFLSTIMTILIYKASNYTIPMPKIKRVSVVANILFSFAIGALMVSVIVFAIPNSQGLFFAMFMGVGIASCFIWENMVPMQKRKREQQLSAENNRQALQPSKKPQALSGNDLEEGDEKTSSSKN